MGETVQKDKPAIGGLGPVGQMMQASLGGSGGQAKPPPPTPRDIIWALKPAWTVGEQFDKAAISLGVSAGPDNAALVVPVPGKLTRGGKLTVTAKAPATGGFAEATRTAEVDVARIKPKITWRDPYPIVKGTKLGGTQQDATIDPAGLKLDFTPAPNTTMNEIGDKVLKVAFAGNDGHEAAAAQVTIRVLADATNLAKEVGESAMLSGRGFKPPSHPKAQEALDNWNASDPSDPTSLRGQAKLIMDNINGKTPDELLDYMRTQVKDADEWYNHLNKKGNERKYPNYVWKLPNGLQVRYKPKGDGQNGLEEPMFCIEARRTDIVGYAQEPSDTAFKVMPNGEAAPYGPSEMDLPDLGSAPLNAQAIGSACGMTHLYCAKPEDQVITWADLGTLEVGTALEAKHLAATALGGAVPTYSRVGAGAIAVGDKLPAGTHRLVASTAKTLRYKPGTKEVQVIIKRKPQSLAWTGPGEFPANGTIDASMVTALGTPVLSFELDGEAITGKPPLKRGTDMTLLVKAAETPDHAEAELEVTISVRKQKWTVEWETPPDIRVGEALTARHLNATVNGSVKLKYTNAAGDTISLGDTLSFSEYGEDTDDGQIQDLTATAPTSAEFESGFATVSINLLRAAEPAKGKQGKPPPKPKKKGKG